MTMEDVWSGPREEWSDIYIKWRAGYDRLAGLPGWIAIHAPLLFQADHRREVGATILGHHVVSARFCRCHGAVAIRFNERVSTDVIRDDNLKTMALVEAAYRSVYESRAVSLAEII